ncbi:hypothetical protein ABK040_008265 [Willaertia magna]
MKKLITQCCFKPFNYHHQQHFTKKKQAGNYLKTFFSQKYQCNKTNNNYKNIEENLLEENNDNPILKHILCRLDEIEDRVKYFENLYENKVIYNDADSRPIIVRFDGYHFRDYTSKYFERPYDRDIHFALVLAAKHLYGYLPGDSVTLSYINSDEINFIFSRHSDKELFQGRSQKFTSIFTSILTSKFNYYLKQLKKNDINLNKIPDAYFDCRIFQLPTINHAIEYIVLKHVSCIRNSKHSFGRAYLDHKQLLDLSTHKIKEIIEQEYGVRWEDCPNEFKYGTFIKRSKFFKKGFNPKTNQETRTERLCCINQCIKISKVPPPFLMDLVKEYTWPHYIPLDSINNNFAKYSEYESKVFAPTIDANLETDFDFLENKIK